MSVLILPSYRLFARRGDRPESVSGRILSMASIFVITIFHIRWRGMRDCGGSYWWIEVNHHGHWGYYVAYACVKFYCDSHDGQEHPEAIAAVQEEGREATVPPTPEPLPKVEG